jgi:hypothetical protein
MSLRNRLAEGPKAPVHAEIEGLAEIQARIRELGGPSVRRILRPGVAKGTRVIAKALKQLSPVRKTRRGEKGSYRGKQLKKSQGQKVKTYKGAVLGIAGPRTGFKLVIGTRVRGKHKGKPITYDPAKTFHLVDLKTKRSQGQEVRRRAVQQTRGEVSRIMHEETGRAYDAEVNRLRAKGRL